MDSEPLTGVADRLRRVEEEYSAGEDRPLAGYIALVGTYGMATGAAAYLLRDRIPNGLEARDVALLGVATHKLSRLITEDPITSPLRAPFTTYEGTSGPAELAEEVRGSGFRHAVGELISCPFCIAQWITTIFVVGLMIAPRLTRTAASILVIVTISDMLQIAYSRAQKLLG